MGHVVKTNFKFIKIFSGAWLSNESWRMKTFVIVLHGSRECGVIC